MPISDTVFSDSFTDAANTPLDCHTPEIGRGWRIIVNDHATLPANRLEVAAGGTTLVASAGAASKKYVYGTRERMMSPDTRSRITVTTVAAGGGGDDPFWLLARVCCPDNLYGAGSYDGGTQRIYKRVNGVVTQIATLAGAIANADYFEFDLKGSRLELYKNGTLILSGSDSAIPSAGRAGFATGALFISTDDTNTTWVFDAYSVKVLRHLVRQDNFTDLDGTLLTAHAPTNGGMWAFGEDNYGVAGTTGLYFSITGNAIVANRDSAAAGLIAILYPPLPVVEYAVEATFPTSSPDTNEPAGVVARFTNSNNYYTGVTYRAADANDKRIYKRVAGVYTLIAQADSGLSAGDTLRLEVENGAQRLYHNDVLVVSGADTALASGDAGIGVGYVMAGTGNVDNNWTIDDFKVYSLGGPLSRDEGGVAGAVKIITAATYTVTSRDRLLVCDTTSNPITINLPPAGQQLGRELEITNIGAAANDVTVTPAGAETIDTFASGPVYDGYGKIIRSTSNTEWWTVGTSSV